MQSYIAWHQASDLHRFSYALINGSRIWNRKSSPHPNNWIVDSQGFSEISNYGKYRFSLSTYAQKSRRWKTWGNLQAIVTLDYPVVDAALAKTGKTVLDHQTLTIDHYDELISIVDWVEVLPVLHGRSIEQYLKHLQQWGDRFGLKQWVGVGSLKQFGHTKAGQRYIEAILKSIKSERPDLQLHGFGLTYGVLKNATIRQLLASSDTSGGGKAAQLEGQNQNDPAIALQYQAKIEAYPVQSSLFERLPPSQSSRFQGVKLSTLVEWLELSSSHSHHLLPNLTRCLELGNEILDCVTSFDNTGKSVDKERDLRVIIQQLLESGSVIDDTVGICAEPDELYRFALDQGDFSMIALLESAIFYRRWDLVKAVISR